LSLQYQQGTPAAMMRPSQEGAGGRGYFAVGVERLSKAYNAGNLLRTAHAFGASFFFTVESSLDLRAVGISDTSKAAEHLPLFQFDTVLDLHLPKAITLVGIELTAEAIELPSFRHPLRAAYILGPERGSLSPEMQALCQYIVKIPMKFCVNVGVAGALVLYDRMISLGRFAERPVRQGGPSLRQKE
jgi:tRNA G18 (ribose-2'-O)-methylase SpoU